MNPGYLDGFEMVAAFRAYRGQKSIIDSQRASLLRMVAVTVLALTLLCIMTVVVLATMKDM